MPLRDVLGDWDAIERRWAAVGSSAVVGVAGLLVAAGIGLALLAFASGMTCACSPPPPAAEVAPAPDHEPGHVNVTFRSRERADHVVVEWSAPTGEVAVAGVDGTVEHADGSARLVSPGSRLTLAETDPDTRTVVVLRVSAVEGGDERVVAERSVQL